MLLLLRKDLSPQSSFLPFVESLPSILTVGAWRGSPYFIPGLLQQIVHQSTCLFPLLQITARAIFLTSWSNHVVQFLYSSQENKPFRTVDTACSELLPSCLQVEPHSVPLPARPSVHMCLQAKAQGFPRTSSLPASHSFFTSQLKTVPLWRASPGLTQQWRTTSTLKPVDDILMVFPWLSPRPQVFSSFCS